MGVRRERGERWGNFLKEVPPDPLKDFSRLYIIVGNVSGITERNCFPKV